MRPSTLSMAALPLNKPSELFSPYSSDFGESAARRSFCLCAIGIAVRSMLPVGPMQRLVRSMSLGNLLAQYGARPCMHQRTIARYGFR